MCDTQSRSLKVLRVLPRGLSTQQIQQQQRMSQKSKKKEANPYLPARIHKVTKLCKKKCRNVRRDIVWIWLQILLDKGNSGFVGLFSGVLPKCNISWKRCTMPGCFLHRHSLFLIFFVWLGTKTWRSSSDKWKLLHGLSVSQHQLLKKLDYSF